MRSGTSAKKADCLIIYLQNRLCVQAPTTMPHQMMYMLLQQGRSNTVYSECCADQVWYILLQEVAVPRDNN